MIARRQYNNPRVVASGASPHKKAGIAFKGSRGQRCLDVCRRTRREQATGTRKGSHYRRPVAIQGKRHGNKFWFMTRYRSDDPRSLALEFDALFARLEYVSRDSFDLSGHRHNGG